MRVKDKVQNYRFPFRMLMLIKNHAKMGYAAT